MLTLRRASSQPQGFAQKPRVIANRQVQTVELPGLNHLLEPCTTGTVAEYGRIEETMAPAALEVVAKWVKAQAGLPTR